MLPCSLQSNNTAGSAPRECVKRLLFIITFADSTVSRTCWFPALADMPSLQRSSPPDGLLMYSLQFFFKLNQCHAVRVAFRFIHIEWNVPGYLVNSHCKWKSYLVRCAYKTGSLTYWPFRSLNGLQAFQIFLAWSGFSFNLCFSVLKFKIYNG